MSEQTPSPSDPVATPAEPVWDGQAAADAVRAKVQTFLLRESEIGMDQRGRLFIDRGSTRANLEFVPREQFKQVYVVITCPVAFYVPESPALFERIARDSDKWYFGHLGMGPYDVDGEHKGQVYIYLSHTLLGDYLDPDEVISCVFSMLNVADEIDNAFVAEFGGEVYDGSK